jgi:uncharacterized membrane protein YesL
MQNSVKTVYNLRASNPFPFPFPILQTKQSFVLIIQLLLIDNTFYMFFIYVSMESKALCFSRHIKQSIFLTFKQIMVTVTI